jgi:hypothetical protein
MIDCSYTTCNKFYHVTCGIEGGLYFDQANMLSYCKYHDPLRVEAEGISNMLNIKSAYPKLAHKPDIREKIKLSVPKVSLILKIRSMRPKPCSFLVDRILCNDLCVFNFERKTEYVSKICNYWAVKRGYNSGYPLIPCLTLDVDKHLGQEWYEKRSLFCYGTSEHLQYEMKYDITSRKMIEVPSVDYNKLAMDMLDGKERDDDERIKRLRMERVGQYDEKEKSLEVKRYEYITRLLQGGCGHKKVKDIEKETVMGIHSCLKRARGLIYKFKSLIKLRRELSALKDNVFRMCYDQNIFKMRRMLVGLFEGC